MSSVRCLGPSKLVAVRRRAGRWFSPDLVDLACSVACAPGGVLKWGSDAPPHAEGNSAYASLLQWRPDWAPKDPTGGAAWHQLPCRPFKASGC